MSLTAEAQRTPKLRFPEFTEEWQAKRLGDFLTFKNGVNADRSKYGSGRKFINVMDVISGQPIYHDAIIGSVEISDKEFLKNEVVFGDLLFQRSSETREEVGQSNIYLDNESAPSGGFVIRGRPKIKIEARYFDALLKTSAVRRDMTSRSGGSTRYNIGQVSLELVAVNVAPNVSEQRKIANFLGAVDSRIDLLRRRRDALAAHKKAMAQRIFSRELRFIKADGTPFRDWEERRLGQISTVVKRTAKETDVPVMTISGGNGFLLQTDRFNQVIAGSSLDNYTLLKRGEFSYNRGASKTYRFGCIYALTTANEALVPFVYHSFRLQVGLVGFYNQFFSAGGLNRQLKRTISSSARMDGLLNIGKSNFFSLSVPIPDLDEQKKIADFLFVLDSKIEAVAKQLDVMRRFKEGLVQQMFV